MDLLQTVENLDVEEIELLQNGNWKIIVESKTNITSKNIEVINLDEEEIVTLDDSNFGSAQPACNSSTISTTRDSLDFIRMNIPPYPLKSLDLFLKNGARQSSNETKRKIIQMFKDDESSIALDQLKISLKCPILKTRMKNPARSKICSHLQCFDLQNVLPLNDKNAIWKCPICNRNASYDNLIIIQYFMDLLQTVENLDVEEIELLQNGNWKIVGELGSKRNTSTKHAKVLTLVDSNVDIIVRNGKSDSSTLINDKSKNGKSFLKTAYSKKKNVSRILFNDIIDVQTYICTEEETAFKKIEINENKLIFKTALSFYRYRKFSKTLDKDPNNGFNSTLTKLYYDKQNTAQKAFFPSKFTSINLNSSKSKQYSAKQNCPHVPRELLLQPTRWPKNVNL